MTLYHSTYGSIKRKRSANLILIPQLIPYLDGVIMLNMLSTNLPYQIKNHNIEHSLCKTRKAASQMFRLTKL